METPKREAPDVSSEAQLGLWCRSPVVFTSPGGNVRTTGKCFVPRGDAKNDEPPPQRFADENSVQRITSVSIPHAQLMPPPPRLRSSFPSQITPLKASNRQRENALFSPFSPVSDLKKPLKKTPSTGVSKVAQRCVVNRPPLTAKRIKQRTAAELREVESREKEFRVEVGLRKQEKLYVKWLNIALQNDAALVFIPRIKLADEPSTFEKMLTTSALADPGGLHALFNLPQLRQRLITQFDSVSRDEILSVMVQVSKRVDDGRLRMKDGCAVLADVGLRKQAMDVVMSYSPAWLQVGLYMVLGVTFIGDAEYSVLEATLEREFFTHSGVAKGYLTNRTVEGLYRDGYLEALGRVILKRLLLLVLVLDKLKCRTAIQDGNGVDGLDGGSVILFRRDSVVKSSRQALQEILKNAMRGEGDLIAHLNTLGYRLYHVQRSLAEFNFEISSFKDLEDGVTLCRLGQLLADDFSVLKKIHLPSESKKRQRNHCEAALETFARAGVSLLDEQGFCITSDSIFTEDRSMMLAFLWNVLLQLQLPRLLPKDALVQEVLRIERMNVDSKVAPEEVPLPLCDILLRWTKAICQRYSYEVQCFSTSFWDGQALCYLISFYMPTVLPREAVAKNNSLESNLPAHNFGLLRDATSRLGFLNEVLERCHMVEKELLWRERNIILLVGLLCSKLVCGTHEERQDAFIGENFEREASATRIQAHYRGWIQRRTLRRKRASGQKIQSAWRSYLSRQRILKYNLAAKKIQRTWIAKREADRIRAASIIQAFYGGRNRKIVDSAVKIQAAWRGFARCKRYSLEKASVQKIEGWWQAVSIRKAYREVRGAAIVIQAYYRRRDQRIRFRKSLTAIQKIQALWRGHAIRKTYVLQKTFVVRIQRRWRRIRSSKESSATAIQAAFRGYSTRQLLAKQKAAASVIKSYYRGFVARGNFTRCRRSVILLQAWTRRKLVQRRDSKIKAVITMQAVWRGYSTRQLFLKKKAASVVIQSYYRSFAARRSFTHCRKGIVLLQALIRRKLLRRRYKAVTGIQAVWRGHSTRQLLARHKAAATVVQSYFRGFVARVDFCRYKKMLQAMIRRKVVQRSLQVKAARSIDIRLNLAARKIQEAWHQHICMKKTACAVRIQAAFRGWKYRKTLISRLRQLHVHSEAELRENRRDAATKIQCCYRGWRSRLSFNTVRRSACLIQACWKGYTARKCQNEELLNLRLRMQNTASTADCNMTLGNRLNEALALLLSFKSVSSILHICATIDLATQHSRYCCERIAEGGAIVKILQLIQTTNRSTPHEQVLKHALSILRNLARYPLLARSILDTRACLCVVAEQLQVHRNKEEIFFKALEIIQFVCKEFPQDVVRTSPLVLRRLEHVKQLLERKVEAERKNAERFPPGANAGRVSAEKKLAEAKVQLQRVVIAVKTLAGTPGDKFQEIQRSSSRLQSRPVKTHSRVVPAPPPAQAALAKLKARHRVRKG